MAPTFDVARHVSPTTESPEWTPELVDGFVQAYFDGRGNMLVASRATGVPFRAAMAKREEDPLFADRLTWADLAYQEVKREEQQRRVMEDPHRAAYMIFDLKSRDPAYTPASGAAGVKINIAFIDKTFRAHPVIEALPGTVEPPLDVTVTPADGPDAG